MNLGLIGMAAALGLSAMGSAFGAGFAGMSSVGAWKRCQLAAQSLFVHSKIKQRTERHITADAAETIKIQNFQESSSFSSRQSRLIMAAA